MEALLLIIIIYSHYLPICNTTNMLLILLSFALEPIRHHCWCVEASPSPHQVMITINTCCSGAYLQCQNKGSETVKPFLRWDILKAIEMLFH